MWPDKDYYKADCEFYHSQYGPRTKSVYVLATGYCEARNQVKEMMKTHRNLQISHIELVKRTKDEDHV